MQLDGLIAIVKSCFFNQLTIPRMWMGLFTYPYSGYGICSMLSCDHTWIPNNFYDKYSRILVYDNTDGYIFMCYEEGTSAQEEPQWIFDPDNRLPVLDGELIWHCVGRLISEYNTQRSQLDMSRFNQVTYFDDSQVDIFSISCRSDEQLSFEINDVPVTLVGCFLADSNEGGNILGIHKFPSSYYVDSSSILYVTRTELIFRTIR